MAFINKSKFKAQNSKGQGLVEYLILVALMAVATIGIVRLLNQTVRSKFASVTYSLQGRQKKATVNSISEDDYKTRDLSDFMNGSASKESQ